MPQGRSLGLETGLRDSVKRLCRLLGRSRRLARGRRRRGRHPGHLPDRRRRVDPHRSMPPVESLHLGRACPC